MGSQIKAFRVTNNIILKLDKDYASFLQNIKERLKFAQLKVANRVNTEVIIFYWQLGKDIVRIQATKSHWGNKFLDQLSHDLQAANPGMSGFSRRSLEYMRLLATLYPDESFTQQPAAQLPWAHIQLLIDKFKDDATRREWYAKEILANGWSRPTLHTHIKSNLYERQGAETEKVSNYQQRLPSPQSDLAHEILKNPYSFDFITISKEAHERDIERELIKHIKDFWFYEE